MNSGSGKGLHSGWFYPEGQHEAVLRSLAGRIAEEHASAGQTFGNQRICTNIHIRCRSSNGMHAVGKCGIDRQGSHIREKYVTEKLKVTMEELPLALQKKVSAAPPCT